MKEVRRIKFTGKNLNDVFALPCVMMIRKASLSPLLVCHQSKMVTDRYMALPGDDIVEYSDGMWGIYHQPSAISPQPSSE